MRVLICDDDIMTLRELEDALKQFFEKEKMNCPELVLYKRGAELLNDKDEKSIVFLDIEMPENNGINVGKILKKQNKNTIIIIVTSYIEYLDQAMDFNVFRYLSKPIDKQRLFRNMRAAIDLYYSIATKIPIETKDGVITLQSSEIIMIEAENRKIIVHTTKGTLLSTRKMDYWLEILPTNVFFRTHRSYIVNFEHVVSFDKGLINLGTNGLKAYLTKRKYSFFKTAYLMYIANGG